MYEDNGGEVILRVRVPQKQWPVRGLLAVMEVAVSGDDAMIMSLPEVCQVVGGGGTKDFRGLWNVWLTDFVWEL